MPMEVSYKLNGMPLDTDGFHVTVKSGWRAPISPRRNVVTVAGRHGSVLTGMTPRFDERELTIRTVAHGIRSTQTAERFLRLCSMPSLTLSKTENDVDGGYSRSMSTRVELTSLSPGDEERPWRPVEQLAAVFAMPDVFWHGEQPMVRELSANGGALVPKPFRIDPYWTRWSGEANNSTSLLADFATMWLGDPNNSPSILFDEVVDGMFGDAPITDPIIRCQSVTGVKITDQSSKTTITWSGTLPSGKPYLYLSPVNLSAWCSDSATAWSGGTSLTGIDWEGEPLEIWPMADGSYRLSAQQTGGTNPIAVRFSPSWW